MNNMHRILLLLLLLVFCPINLNILQQYCNIAIADYT